MAATRGAAAGRASARTRDAQRAPRSARPCVETRKIGQVRKQNMFAWDMVHKAWSARFQFVRDGEKVDEGPARTQRADAEADRQKAWGG